MAALASDVTVSKLLPLAPNSTDPEPLTLGIGAINPLTPPPSAKFATLC